MEHSLQFYIDGAWVEPTEPRTLDVIDPSTEEAFAQIALGGPKDVDRAVAAAKKAFESFSRATVQERVELLQSIMGVYQRRAGDIAAAISQEMGAPGWLSQNAQTPFGMAHLATTTQVLQNFRFEEQIGKTMILHEPIGVCGLITPWNWPINQIMCKVAPALAAGCTMVLKPSEIAPMNALILAEVLHEAGVPAGVFNLVNGDGAGVGSALSSHPDIDMVSFTGSTRAGILVAKAAADTVKRVSQELGGKSANIVLDDANLEKAIPGGLTSVFLNCGQSCNAPTRMLVPEALQARVVEIARNTVPGFTVGAPSTDGAKVGPAASEAQWSKIQRLIQVGIDEGATLVAGGVGRPDGLDRGYFVKPTVFSDVRPDMTIAREEIFGPVLSILPYGSEEEAIRIANDTEYGLSGAVQSSNIERARAVARRIRSGNVHLNGTPPDFNAPFGGYKQSGNGREWGRWGFHEFLEVKAVTGWE